MNKQKWILATIVLLMVGGTAGVLAHLRTNQTLGKPGVATAPLPDSQNLQVLLPEQVLDYTSKLVPEDKIVINTLPKDTSYGQRLYRGADGFQTQVNVVLMGTDRTSIHKPQFCLTGQGYKIDDAASGNEIVHVERPKPYDLPVMKLVSTRQVVHDGQNVTLRGIYVYWYVADDAISADASGFQRMWWSAKKLLTTGILQRWAYISYFSVCLPGQEKATFERMKKLIAASVPEFQLVANTK